MTTPERTPVDTPGSYQKQHAKVLRFEISVGEDDDAHTLVDFEQAIRQALNVYKDDSRGWFTYNNLTMMGGYYIIDGKVCMPADYDPATKNRKPGTFPPQWAGGPDPRKVHLVAAPTSDDDEDEDDVVTESDDQSREFVRVAPTLAPRDPVTGRRPRRDKGVKRGPRKAGADTIDLKAKVAELGEQMKEATNG